MMQSASRTWMFRCLLIGLAAVAAGCTAKPITPVAVGIGSTGGSSTTPGTDNNSAPPAPSSFTGTSLTSSTVTITWVDNAIDETGFKVYRSTSANSGFSLIATLGVDITTYTDTGRTSSTAYYYQITSYGSGGESAALTGTVTTLSATAPSNLQAVALSSDSISLTWQDTATTETTYVVKRAFRNSAAAMETIATLPPNTVRYVDTGLHPGSTYYYQIEAFNGATSLDPSNIASGTTFSGTWTEISGSATSGGISTSSVSASLPDHAMDSNGRVVAVWEQLVAGINQIYLAIYDPNFVDESGENIGWKPIMMNMTVTDVNYDNDDDPQAIVSIVTSVRQTSMQGNGFSLASGDAQNPKIAYDSTRDLFVVLWEEQRNGKYEIVGRSLHNSSIRLNSLTSVLQGTFSGTTVANNTIDADVVNREEDDGFSTGPSTWNISSTTATDSMRPSIADFSGVVYSVWEEYNTATRTWQILGAASTLAAVAAYPAVPAIPAVAAIATVGGANSNTLAGSISQAGAGFHARSPSIAVGDATHIYVAWQSTDPVNGDTDISTNFSDGTTFAATPTVSVANTGASIQPRLGVDQNATSPVPYLAWADNTLSNNYNIYVLQGTLVGVFATNLTDGTITSGDTTTTGVSGIASTSRANALTPAIGVSNTSVIVTWQDTSSSKSNIYVKRFLAQDDVPGEDASWTGMDDSDTGEGISFASVGAFHPSISVSPSGIISVIWEDNQGTVTSPVYQTYLRRW